MESDTMSGRYLSATTLSVILHCVLYPNDTPAAVAKALHIKYRTAQMALRRHADLIKEAQDACRATYGQDAAAIEGKEE